MSNDNIEAHQPNYVDVSVQLRPHPGTWVVDPIRGELRRHLRGQTHTYWLTQKTVMDRIVEILGDQLVLDVSCINGDSRLSSDLNADSLDIVELVMDLECEFEIDIPDEDVERKNLTVDQLHAIVAKLYPVTDTLTVTMTDAQFKEIFIPETGEDGETYVRRELNGGESDAVIMEAIRTRRCWTAVDVEGKWCLVEGNCSRNRLYNVITEKPWTPALRYDVFDPSEH